MNISVVMTAMNDQETIMEATESILSQSRLPDQFGLSLGPSVDRTHDFVEFYRDEFDFIAHCDEPAAAQRGRSRLRMEALYKVKGDYVLFVPADVFLYRDALSLFSEAVSRSSESLSAVFGHLNYIDVHDEVTAHGLEEFGADRILELGPVNPSSVLLNLSVCRDHGSVLSDMRCGPFTFLAWVIEVLSEPEAPAEVVTESIGETWCFREGDYCWDRSVFEGLVELTGLLEDIVPEASKQVTGWMESAFDEQDLGQLQTEFEVDVVPGQDSSNMNWWDAPVSFPE